MSARRRPGVRESQVGPADGANVVVRRDLRRRRRGQQRHQRRSALKTGTFKQAPLRIFTTNLSACKLDNGLAYPVEEVRVAKEEEAEQLDKVQLSTPELSDRLQEILSLF